MDGGLELVEADANEDGQLIGHFDMELVTFGPTDGQLLAISSDVIVLNNQLKLFCQLCIWVVGSPPNLKICEGGSPTSELQMLSHHEHLPGL